MQARAGREHPAPAAPAMLIATNDWPRPDVSDPLARRRTKSRREPGVRRHRPISAAEVAAHKTPAVVHAPAHGSRQSRMATGIVISASTGRTADSQGASQSVRGRHLLSSGAVPGIRQSGRRQSGSKDSGHTQGGHEELVQSGGSRPEEVLPETQDQRLLPQHGRSCVFNGSAGCFGSSGMAGHGVWKKSSRESGAIDRFRAATGGRATAPNGADND